jgi:hypothetical protein
MKLEGRDRSRKPRLADQAFSVTSRRKRTQRPFDRTAHLRQRSTGAQCLAL